MAEYVPDYERRISNLERRMEWIDEHGTRGISALQTQLSTMQRDLSKMETTVGNIDAALDRASSRNWPQIIALIVAMIPMYALVITLVVGNHG